MVTLMPLPVEALAAIGRFLSNHNWTQRLRVRINRDAALLADFSLAKRADSKTQ
jgi:hypothetical protein